MKKSDAHINKINEEAIEFTGIGIYKYDFAGNILYINRNALKIFELDDKYPKPSNVIGENISNLIIYIEPQRSLRNKIKKKGKVIDLEYNLKTLKGNTKWLLNNSYLIKDPDTNKEAIQVIIKDITERKQSEEALSHSEFRYRELTNSLPEIIFEMDTKGKLTFVNKTGFDLYGYTEERLKEGIDVFEILVPEDHQRAADNIKNVLNENGSEVEEYTTRNKNGQKIPIIVYSRPIIENKKVIGLRGIVIDISDRVKAERDLVEEKERLGVTLKSISEGVIATDKKGNIVLINKVGEKLTGHTQSNSSGQPLNKIFTVIDQRTNKTVNDPIINVLKHGEIIENNENYIIISKDGNERLISSSSAPIRDKGNNIIGAVIVFRDITERIIIDKELQKTHKIESLSILAGGIAHDFNNILTSILGNISLATLNSEDGSEIYQYLKNAENAIKQAKDLSRQLLTFAKGGIPVKKITSIIDLIKETTGFVLRGSNVDYELKIDKDLWQVNIDEGQINQLINNLVINADQAMPDGGIIKIKVENIEINNNDIIPLPKGKYIKLSFSDTGSGIKEDYLNNIFDPYFTTKQKGSGLGLATCYSIVKKHDGFIDVESELGKGTTFIIYLSTTKGIQKQDKKTEEIILNGNERVLVMDDEYIVRKVAGRMLEHLGYKVDFASDGHEAVKMYSKNLKTDNSYNVVIMDLTVPGKMGGKKAIKEILKLDPKANVIVSSGYSQDSVMVNPKEYGFKNNIAKPYKIEELSKVLKEAALEN